MWITQEDRDTFEKYNNKGIINEHLYDVISALIFQSDKYINSLYNQDGIPSYIEEISDMVIANKREIVDALRYENEEAIKYFSSEAEDLISGKYDEEDFSESVNKKSLIKKEEKLTLKSYLEKKLTVSPKEAQLIEATIKEYIQKKKKVNSK